MNLLEIHKLGIAHFHNKYPLENGVKDETINRHADAEYFFAEGMKWAIRHLSGHATDAEPLCGINSRESASKIPEKAGVKY